MKRFLSDEVVIEIYLLSANPDTYRDRFNVSLNVVRNIKNKHTYKRVTENLISPGEIQLYNLTWDNICEIRAGNNNADFLSEKYNITRETVYNIRSGKTRVFK